jgi:hypothetical protein
LALLRIARANLSGSYSTVISVFAIIILSAIAGLYRSGHEEFVGGIEDPSPEDGNAVAGTIFTAVIVYAVRLPFRIPPRSPLGHFHHK